MAVMNYRTQDGLPDYGFSIEYQVNLGWRVYIIFRPLHHGLDDSTQLPHQSTDDHGRHYVNWSAKLDSLGEARTVAELWAELAQRYERAEVAKKRANAAAKDLSTPRGLRTDAA